MVINVWITHKGTVCLYLDSDHLNSGPAQLLRQNGADCELLERIFQNPRQTDKEPLNHLTEELITEFEEIFYMFDENEDGSILLTKLGTVSFTSTHSRVLHLDVEVRSEELLTPALLCHKEPARASNAPY